MYSKNVATFLAHLVKNGVLQPADGDEIAGGTVVARGGKLVHPMVVQALEGKK
jgi:NAD(P) transhydrogenase subunit alpha